MIGVMHVSSSRHIVCSSIPRKLSSPALKRTVCIAAFVFFSISLMWISMFFELIVSLRYLYWLHVSISMVLILSSIFLCCAHSHGLYTVGIQDGGS